MCTLLNFFLLFYTWVKLMEKIREGKANRLLPPSRGIFNSSAIVVGLIMFFDIIG